MATICPYCKSPIRSTDEYCPKCHREIDDNRTNSYSSRDNYDPTPSYDYDSSDNYPSSSPNNESYNSGD